MYSIQDQLKSPTNLLARIVTKCSNLLCNLFMFFNEYLAVTRNFISISSNMTCVGIN